MSIVLIVDAACDLPKDFLDKRGIQLLPISIKVDEQIYIDDKDNHRLQAFYRQNLLTLKHEAESTPYSSGEIHQLVMRDIVPHYDFGLIQTVSQKRSAIHANCIEAQALVQKSCRQNKARGDTKRAFSMRVMNSGTLFTGQGVLAAFTSDLIAANRSKHDILRLAEAFKRKIYGFVIPPDVAYIRERARKRGETSLSALGAFVAKSLSIKPIIQAKNDATNPIAKVRGFDQAVNRLFDYGVNRIKLGLLSPYVVVSIAGDIADLKKFAGFLELKAVAKLHKVEIISCVMGLTSGLNVGPGAVSLALAAEDHTFS
ncbi:DegV family protein [Reinekea sp.]|uniref:DegV family protein n=1 Tax=Reinekea sp. TaxID=1970455 RepID=UPI002A80A45F|nr:DegV family protein [Reinekea sp.]